MAVCAQPLPTLTKGEDEARALAGEQRADDSLFEWRKKAVKMEDGYVLEKHDVLVQVKEVVPGREAKCLCVPVARRRDLLEVAYKSWWPLFPQQDGLVPTSLLHLARFTYTGTPILC